MDFTIGEELTEIRTAVRELCEGFPGEYWRALEPDRYPEEFVAALTENGWLAALVPEEYGGAGLTLTAASVILEEINATGGNSGACHAQMYIMGTILRHGSEKQKERYLPKIASGDLRLQAFGVTEPTAGSDTTKIQTTAERVNGGYVMRGQKIWTSRAMHSDLMLLLARTTPVDEVEKKTEGLSTFIVDMKAALEAGTMTIRPIKTLMNHATTEIFLDGVEVPEENLVGVEGKGFRYVLDGMNAERVLIAAECIGDGRWFTEKATAYVSERVVFGRPIGANQGVQFPIAQAHAQIEAADLCATRLRGSSTRVFLAAPRRTWRSSSQRKPRGRLRTPASTPTAASASPRSTTSSASSVRRASSRWRPCRTTSSSPTSASTSSACLGATSKASESRYAPDAPQARTGLMTLRGLLGSCAKTPRYQALTDSM